jgi:hypothetical protein
MIGRNACDLPEWWRKSGGKRVPLEPQGLYSSARIVGDLKTPRGVMRTAVGTGFLVAVPSESEPDAKYMYLLTAHHVIDGEANVEVELADPWNKGALYERVGVTDWRQPITGLDLAIAPFKLKGDHETALWLEVNYNLVHALPVFPGQQLYYVGLLSPLDRPMVRSGTMGAVDQTGIPHEPPYEYVAHLADCRSYGGFSGSPCFAEFAYAKLEPMRHTHPPTEELGEVGELVHMHFLCGMFTGHLDDDEDPVGAVSRYGVGVILRSTEIWEALMSEDMRKERVQWDDEAKVVAEGSPGPRLKSVSLPAE